LAAAATAVGLLRPAGEKLDVALGAWSDWNVPVVVAALEGEDSIPPPDDAAIC
jgi:hypothetical protein